MIQTEPLPQRSIRLETAFARASDLCTRTAGFFSSGLQFIWFQINPDVDSATARRPSETDGEGANEGEAGIKPARKTIPWIEILLIGIMFGLFAGQLPPDVNESHYLTKSKHFWNNGWCPDDLFLGSAFSHWWFYVSTGWLSRFVSLETYAWIGRIITWSLLAFAWHRLSFRLMPRHGFAFISAALFLVLNERFHLAGEWVIGGFESKGIAYALVLLAITEMISSKWHRVWVYTGAACAFHVLVGGWSLLACLFCLAITSLLNPSRSESEGHRESQTRKSVMLSLAIAITFVLIGAVPPLITDLSAEGELSTAASRVYVQSRISHHLLFGAFPTIFVARFTVVIIAWGMLAVMLLGYRPIRRLQLFCAASLLISLGGLVLSGFAEQQDWLGDASCRLLRFYWFRLSDFALPAAFSISASVVLGHWIHNRFASNRTRLSAIAICLLILTATGMLIVERNEDPRPRADQRSLPDYEGQPRRTQETYENWLRVCDWVKQNTPEDAVFITPSDQQTFKWYAGRTEVACWKDIPQDAASILQWSNRLPDVFFPQQRFEQGLMSYTDEQLINLAGKYGADYLLLPQKHIDLARPPTGLNQVYPESGRKSTYVVLQIPSGP